MVLAAILFLPVQAQIYDPVTWDFSFEKTGENKYDLVFRAFIEEGSHIYSMDIPSGGPIPTSFRYDTTGSFSFSGTTFEVTTPEELFDEAFGFKIKSFSHNAEFRQEIAGLSSSFTVSGAVNFMSCNNTTCSPPKDVEFGIKINGGADNKTVTSGNSIVKSSSEASDNKGLLVFFLLSALAGFAAILTPCVFPMIPMTIAFFARDTGNRKKSVFMALIFGISIILIYTSL
jgi:thiol:disulfide interchange protein